MQLDILWIVDPKTKEPSVSLTNLVLAIVFLLTAGALNLAGVVQTTSIALEYFGLASALYFGRRMNINGKTYDSQSNNQTGVQ